MDPHREHDKPKKSITIIVNGRRHEIRDDEVSFAEITEIAFPGQSQGENICLTVTYMRGHGHKPEGTLVEGEEVKIKEGMIFNVTRTDKS